MPGWQEYLDIALQDPKVTSAAIFGHDGSTWAASAGFSSTPAEVKELLAGIDDNGRFHENGVVVAGVKYMFLGAPGTGTFAARKGTARVSGLRTPKAFLVATAQSPDEPLDLPSVRKAIQMMADVGF